MTALLRKRAPVPIDEEVVGGHIQMMTQALMSLN